MVMPRKVDPPKNCEFCSTPLERKRFGERLEDRSNFRRRRFCSHTCGSSRRVVTSSAARWRARKLAKASCEACGETRKLCVHHVNGNEQENDPSNLQTLCAFCHDFWHAMLKRRGLPIAGRVPVLVSTGKPGSLASSKGPREEPPDVSDELASAAWGTRSSRSARK